MKFNYKVGFWLLLVLSFLLAIYQYLIITDLEIDLAIAQFSASSIKNDSRTIGELMTNGIHDKEAIKNYLDVNYAPSDGIRAQGDTLFLDSSYLVFKQDSLISIIVE